MSTLHETDGKENTVLPTVEPASDMSDQEAAMASPPKVSKGWRFWLIFVAVCVATLVVAVDVSIISTALPTIAEDLHSAELFVWVANAYVLATTVVQPIYGQMANIFGRRSLTIISVLLFMLGSGLAGGANSTAMLIAARVVQGLGGGGIITLGEIIICDLLPLRERGQYSGLIAGTYAIGTVIGPVLGGVFTQHVTWRWVFYINLPICGMALALIVPFLNLKYHRQGTIVDRIKRIDWIGATSLTTSVTAILLALAWAGTKHSWSSWRTILPLILGFAGMLGFFVHQFSGHAAEPTMPPKLFSNRTSVSIFVMAFVHGILLLYVTYFMPVYFQAVRGATPTRSGVEIFPIATTIAPAAAVSGILVTITGKYRLYHFLGFALMAAGCGSLSTLDANSSMGAWIGFQLMFGLGNGMVFNTMIPPLLASLPSSEVATATATWTFMRSFGQIWGIAIPSAIFNQRIDTLVQKNLSAFPNIAQLLVRGGAYQQATAAFIRSLPESDNVRGIVQNVYVEALKTVWYVSIPFAVIGIPIALFVKSYKLTNELETEFGMREEKARSSGGS